MFNPNFQLQILNFIIKFDAIFFLTFPILYITYRKYQYREISNISTKLFFARQIFLSQTNYCKWNNNIRTYSLSYFHIKFN